MKLVSSMRNNYTKLIFGFLVSIFSIAFSPVVEAQTYPVQANVYTVPPYGNHLEDYYTTSREKLVVSLLNRDQLKPVLEVRLRMTITASNGLKIQSKEDVNYPTITLDANIPIRLTQDDLAPYFQHINSSGFLSQGKLPDGMVEFTFQAIEKYTGRILSAPATGRVWLTSQKPPILRLPSNAESIAFRDPLNQKFQWEPQHKNISQVEYEFELRELPNNGAAPQSAFLYSPIIHQERLLYSYLIYDMMMPPLEPNKMYGWRVRAIAKDGVDELNLFENNGYSEIYFFTTQTDCQYPINLSSTLQGRRLDLKWFPSTSNNEFVVQYRPKYGTNVEDWVNVNTFEDNASIYDMQRGTVYEYRVGGICTTGQPVFTPVYEITIPAVDSARILNCGVPPVLDLENKERLPELKVGDIVHLSDYPMTVTKVLGANGNFTGEGWVPVNWLLETKWAVEFSNITVNTDYRLVAGSVRSKYDETEGNIANLDDITEGGTQNTANGIVRVDVKVDFTIPDNPSFEYNEDTKELIVFSTNGQIVGKVELPTNNEGKVVFPITIQDNNGNIYKIGETSYDNDGTNNGVVSSENPDDNPTNIKVDLECAAKVVEDLTLKLILSIKEKLLNSNDEFFKYAYKDVDILKNIVKLNPSNEGGSYRNGVIYVGLKGFIDPNMGSDGDIMATIFHEYMHYIAFQYKIYPKRYDNIDMGIIYSEKINIGEKQETHDMFMMRIYEIFLSDRYNKDYEKYSQFPIDYYKLDIDQKGELDDFIKKGGYEPSVIEDYYQYLPSNHILDEINAHNKTKEANKLNVFIMSDSKLNFYEEEIDRYKNKLDVCKDIERRFGYTEEGYKIK